jgi:cytochrome oxidase Cu insertion factor (SCO1/SenC/PrrC family)
MAERKPFARGRALAAVAAIAVGAGAGAALALTHRGGASRTASPVIERANVVWPAAKRRAPDFALRDQTGSPVSLRAYRGQVVILTFIDPVCTTLCPLEAKALDRVEQELPGAQRPAVVAVSVNPWGDERRFFRSDARKWRLGPSWRWAVGSRAQLARVWQAYAIAVRIRRFRAAGVTTHRIDHTEAAYVIDRRGFERALFVYPFSAGDVENTVRRLSVNGS